MGGRVGCCWRGDGARHAGIIVPVPATPYQSGYLFGPAFTVQEIIDGNHANLSECDRADSLAFAPLGTQQTSGQRGRSSHTARNAGTAMRFTRRDEHERCIWLELLQLEHKSFDTGAGIRISSAPCQPINDRDRIRPTPPVGRSSATWPERPSGTCWSSRAA